MKKSLLSLILIVFTCVNAWGAEEYSWNSTSKTLTIKKAGAFADGVMTDYSTTSTAPWYSHRNDVLKISVADGITHIGEQAFYSLGSQSVDITLPASLTSIGEKAFYSSSNTNVGKIYFKGTPAQWASIDFQGTSLQYYAHPFGKSNASNRKLYFYNNTSSASSIVYIEPTITEIKQFAFYKVNSITEVCIPGTVTNIRQYAFYNCSALTQININCSTAPTLGTDALTGIGNGTASNVNLYRPSTNSGYGISPWMNYTKPEGSACATSGNLSEGSIPWSLDANGVLTIDATDKETKSIEFNLAGASYPWGMFRRIVYKLKVKGEMTGIGNILQYHYGISEVIIDQTKIPTSGEEVAVNTPGATNYGKLYNQRDNLKLTIRPASLADGSASNLGSAPWSDDKWDIQLSDNVVLSDRANNSTLVSNLQTYFAGKTVTLQLGRSLSKEYYNTFCSPINMDASLVESTFGAGTNIYSFNGTSYNEELDELTLNFNESQNYIEAGVPYLIWPTNNVSNPTFTNVNPSDVATSAGSVAGTYATFYGTLAPVDVSEGNKNFIFLQANNILNWASEGTLYGMRAYWLLTSDVPARALAKQPEMRIGQTETAIGEVQSQKSKVESRKILRNGELIIIRDGVEYTIFGGHRK